MDEQHDDLARRLRDGDRSAYAELVLRYQDAVRGFIAMWAPSAQEADDIAQEVFLVALKNIHTLEPGRDLKTWLLGVASNLTRQSWRRMSRSQPKTSEGLDEILSRQALAVYQEREEKSGERQEALSLCIAGLPEKTRTLFMGYVVDEKTSRELAGELKMTEGTVRAAVSRIRTALRECIERRIHPERA